MDEGRFAEMFQKATGHEPYPYQTRLALSPELPQLIDVPTGAGKTAAVVMAWLWRRRFAAEYFRKATPRRLVYCLPMRVLVEQTRDNVAKWLENLGMLAKASGDGKAPQDDTTPINGWAAEHGDKGNRVAVTVLMGGEDKDEWDLYPERDAVIIGTQDMLLSRMLNRGYAASRSRWPMQFGLLNTDCLWVFDEIQLMGTGLATTAQMEAFRRLLEPKDGPSCRSIWMSATLQKDWLETVDLKLYVSRMETLRLSEIDLKKLNERWIALKPLKKAEAAMGDAAILAKEVLEKHKRSTRTIVVLNTVRRACDLFDALQEGNPSATLVLLHSRFRPDDRQDAVKRVLANSPPEGTIVVSTQVIEAGVDVSATTLFTELAPWASLVQRFGRCNRFGKENENAGVYWVGLPEENPEKMAPPYEIGDLMNAEKRLNPLTDVGLKSLPSVNLRFEHTHVVRRKDIIDLFDTTPDLAGNDIDIDRFVREVGDSDVHVFWRDYGETPNSSDDKKAEPRPRREELCPVPIGEFKDFVKDKKRNGMVWRWNFLEKRWEKADADSIAPGQVFLVHAKAGGYSPERGWDKKSEKTVEPIPLPEETRDDEQDAYDDDRQSCIGIWQTISQHTNEVCDELAAILGALPSLNDVANALRHAARWHDRGKAHEVFQNALPSGAPDSTKIWAKAPGTWKDYGRKYFRHELASALTVLMNEKISNDDRNLAAYLVAAHHGKVRLSIRSLPNEKHPDDDRRFARGVWDDDALPPTDLGGIIAPAVKLSLEPMELGLCEYEPFAGQPSWAERMLHLRDEHGPFRLAYLEAILRAADMRASQRAETRARERNFKASDSRRIDIL